MRIILDIVFLFIFITLNVTKIFSQKIDTIIKTEAYISYYSYQIKNPCIVTYNLYKGGGDCDRNGFRFKTGGLKQSATSKDFYKSGYDIGHLANSEDFAYDCILDESTFRFWNCLPQTPELNRGVWKSNENEIRNLSQSDSLFIICGGFFNKTFIGDSVFVPDSCFKIVYSYKQKKVVMCHSFTNSKTPVKKELDYRKLNLFLIKKHKVYINKLIKK